MADVIGLSDLVDIARRNFERAHRSLDADLALTRTPAEARAVRRNKEMAEAAYMDLLTASLDALEGDWEALAGRARAAADAAEKATEVAADQAGRFRLMADVTSSLSDVATALNG